ncbi:MAG TPA: Ig-like domain-containing protein, partial [Acidimicrobiales bacterium]|nr:Ig-like domain-containing protein [Acidimicrobiales bacterium]
AAVPVTAGAYSATLSASQLPAGTYSLAFTYAGTGTTFGSSTSPATTLAVDQAATVTTLSLSSPSVAYGTEGATTLSVQVSSATAAIPVGTVTVTSGGVTLCTVTLATGAGTCTLSARQLTTGTYPLVAGYAGTANFVPSSDASKTLGVVQAAAPAVSFTVAPSTVAYGAEGTAVPTVTVTSPAGTPSGTVTVAQGATTLCTITLPATTCALAPSVLVPGSYTGGAALVATYDGDTNFPSATGSAGLTVTKAATATTLAASAGSATYGAEDAVVYTATVASTTTGTPTGTVTVQRGATVLCASVPLVDGVATCHAGPRTLDAATYSAGTGITATYSGDPDFTGSTSTPLSLTVRPAPTRTTLAVSATTVVYGLEHTVVFTTTVTSTTTGTPTGQVVVSTGSTTLCTVTLVTGAGTCRATATALTVTPSPYSVLATYQGATDFGASTSSSQNLTVIQATTSTSSTLTITRATVPYGDEDAVHYTVTVTPQGGGTPTGLVTVSTGATTLCTFTLAGGDGGVGTCTGPALLLDAGTYQVKATYAGDVNFHSSVSPTKPLVVTRADTTTSLTLSPASVTYGAEQHEVFTVAVAPAYAGVPTGTVTVQSGSTVLCTVTLDSAAGTCSPSAAALGAGTPQITAVYGGDDNFNPSSTASASTLTVTKAAAAASVSVSPSVVPYGQEQLAVFTVTVTAATSGTPTGTAAVMAGSTTLCTVTLAAGRGTCTTGPTTLPVSTDDLVVADYAGDGNFLPATSAPVSLTVGPTATVTTVRSSANPSNPGKTVTFTATVSAPAAGAGTPVGSVTFTEGPTVLCPPATLSDGVATCTTTLPVTPTQTIGAAYHGAAAFQPSSASYLQQVNHGYWTVATDGGVFAFGDTQFYGSMAMHPLNKPVVGIAATADAGGYWLVASDGGIFAFGDAVFYGSTGSMHLNAPVVGMEPTPDGKGYWLVASDGGLFAFGDAPFYGSEGARPIPSPVVGMVATNDGKGYWEVTRNGSVYAFGDAQYEGGATQVSGTIVGLAPTPDGKGYWLATSTGGVYSFGDAQFFGAGVGMSPSSPIVGVGSTFDGGGYWLVAANGAVFAFGDAVYDGSEALSPLHAPMVSIADM